MNNLLGFSILALILFILTVPTFFTYRLLHKMARLELTLLLFFAFLASLVTLPVIALIINTIMHFSGQYKETIGLTFYFLLPLIYAALGVLASARLKILKNEFWRLVSVYFFVGSVLILPVGWVVEIIISKI